ncbi:hypothetical protein [Modestobacter sp. SSW1-42]|uniref:hypothetical protein n=1 Tax=Modestobacter sp. SSW1-42 TaxID=596372 RepID=UPI003987CE77
MRLIFRRMADRRPVETRVERDDGVVFEMRGAGGGADLPHDLVHALVERELQVPEGIWDCVAEGVVWNSMRHVSGRQPPHAAERSVALKRERGSRIQQAELLADVVARLARGAEVLPTEVTGAGHPAARLDAAAAALRAAQRSWAGLPPGETLVVEWVRPGRRPGRRGR